MSKVREGRRVVTGRILNVLERDTGWKLLLEQGNRTRLWGPLPAGLWNARKQERIRFTATVVASDEERFGFFNRPEAAERSPRGQAEPVRRVPRFE